MPSELIGANVVVVARQFNPSVFSQLWLIRNGIVSEDSFTNGCFYADEVAKTETQQFSLLVVPPQLQFQPRVRREEESELIQQKVGGIVNLLPHTPFTAVGLNFTWRVWSQQRDLHAYSQSLFWSKSSPFYELFGDADDTLYGAYVSKDMFDCRLRLDIKPIDHLPNDEQSVRQLLFAFNFQLDVPRQQEEDSSIAIQQHLQQWDRARAEATRIIAIVERCGEEPQ